MARAAAEPQFLDTPCGALLDSALKATIPFAAMRAGSL